MSYVTGCRSAAFALYFPLVCAANQTASPNAARVCPEPETCSSPLEVTGMKIHEGLEGVWMQWEAGSSHWDGRSNGGRWRDADKCANERLSCAEPLVLLLLLDCLWHKIRLDRLQINQAVDCLLANYFCRYVAPVKLLPLLSPKLSKQWPPVASQTDDMQFAPLPKQHLDLQCFCFSFFGGCSMYLMGEVKSGHGTASFPWGWELSAVLPVLLSQLDTDSTKKSPSQLSSLEKKKKRQVFLWPTSSKS